MSDMPSSRSSGASGPNSIVPFDPAAAVAGASGAISCAASRDPIAVELSVEGAAGKAKEARRLDALAARGLQRAQDLLALRGLERQLREALPVHRALGMGLEEVRRQVFGQQHAALADDHRALEHVRELAHVARPGVARQDVEHVWRDAAHRAAELLVER